MRIGKAWVIILVVLFAGNARADVVVFGDSLSDVGNFEELSGGAIPPTPLYAKGRFSNGSVWVEKLARRLRQPVPKAALRGGTNFAFNGARASGVSPYGVPDVPSQIAMYLASKGNALGHRDLFVIWAGANDIFFGATAGEIDFVPNAVAAIQSSVTLLREAGARRILILNLPPLGETPFFNRQPVLSAQLNFASNQFNRALSEVLESPRRRGRENGVEIANIEGLFGIILCKPKWFRLRNVTDSCTVFDPTGTGLGTELVPGVDPKRFLFWDSVHPTSRGHEIIANAVYLQMQMPVLRR